MSLPTHIAGKTKVPEGGGQSRYSVVFDVSRVYTLTPWWAQT
jgi:hypothetical protein